MVCRLCAVGDGPGTEKQPQARGIRPGAHSRQPEPNRPSPKSKGLSYREQQEWDQIERKIVEAEQAVATCQAAMEDPAMVSDAGALEARCEALEAAHTKVEQLYARWSTLEEKRSQT